MNPQLLQSALLAMTAVSSSLTSVLNSISGTLLQLTYYMYLVDTNGNRDAYEKTASWIGERFWLNSGEICAEPRVPQNLNCHCFIKPCSFSLFETKTENYLVQYQITV
jgi:hypothetical protein